MHPPNYPPPHTTTITTSIVGSKDLRIVLLREGSKSNSKKDCPCFQDDPVKIRGERLGNLSQEDDKMTESKTQDLRQSSRLLQVSSSSTPFNRVESGVGGWGGLPGHLQPSGSSWERAGLQRRGEPPADLRVAARASPQGQGASRCPARQRQLLQRRFQERAVSPGRAPPSCFPRRPRGTVDYRSSLHLPVRRRQRTRWRGPTSPPPPSPRPLHSFRNLPGAEFTVTILSLSHSFLFLYADLASLQEQESLSDCRFHTFSLPWRLAQILNEVVANIH